MAGVHLQKVNPANHFPLYIASICRGDISAACNMLAKAKLANKTLTVFCSILVDTTVRMKKTLPIRVVRAEKVKRATKTQQGVTIDSRCTISSNAKNEQVLDKLQVERERGITVKAQTASLIYNHQGIEYLLNLIDTPGHVDFNYEVARSLAPCQGVILLVDANQGVQAQTVANFYLAFEAELAIIPVMNKIDLKVAKPDEVMKQLHNVFDIRESEVLKISAKNGTGVENVLKAVIERIPPPNDCDREKPLRALIFDSSYDKYKGTMVNIAVKDGIIRRGQKIQSIHNKKTYEVNEIGLLHPDRLQTDGLYAGQVGYLFANIKAVGEAVIGDCYHKAGQQIEPLSGFKPAKPMVFAGIYPTDQSEYPSLRTALSKLMMNDPSVSIHKDSSDALGQGWRVGFLGLLHMDVFCQRLEQEFDTNVIITSPNVPFKVKITGDKFIKEYGGDEVTILNPSKLPSTQIISEYQEPIVKGTIITPDEFLAEIIDLLMDKRARNIEQSYIDNKRIICTCILPLNEIVIDFFDHLKSISSGYASFDYEDQGYQETSLAKIEILLNKKEVQELSQIAHVSKAVSKARSMVYKLKETLPRQLFEVIIQAKVGGRIIARENLKALRKDVLAKCYGGDVTRKMKLLRRQAEGKKRLRKIGNITVPKDTFISVLKTSR
ncbi:DgyrCDS3713 [Dimorphilus gyrociliatus]|uniref:Translation factor GUF1 homolog, mitochondrial n=1 Tax=Dimorphilus gyrociliatus TaxID=2664684 RepID=A0A7I8VEH9_9ANNE|nr:DgyrCDS3713 [Dimorphilus gyrociliatus]